MALSQALLSRTQQLNDTSIMFTRHLLTNLRTTSRQRMDAGQSRAGFFATPKIITPTADKNAFAHALQLGRLTLMATSSPAPSLGLASLFEVVKPPLPLNLPDSALPASASPSEAPVRQSGRHSPCLLGTRHCTVRRVSGRTAACNHVGPGGMVRQCAISARASNQRRRVLPLRDNVEGGFGAEIVGSRPTH